MNKPCLLAYARTTFVHSQIETVAEAQKLDAYFATQGEQLSQLVKTMAPFMMLLDLSGQDSGWMFRHISTVKSMKSDFPIVGLVANDEEAMRERAERYGCNAVLTKKELPKKLTKVVQAALEKRL